MDYRKPRWWKRSVRSYWLIFVILPFAVILTVLTVLFLQGVITLTELLQYAVVAGVGTPFSYYIQAKAPLKPSRTRWDLTVGCGIACLILLVLLGVFGKTLVLILGPWPAVLLSFGVALALGGLLADYIGKRRDYR
jgi:hypothetical protein